MIVLIWAALLSSVRGNSAERGTPAEKEYCNSNGFCVTLTEGEITAEAGLCVVIPCSFTTGSGFIPQSIVWYKCEPSYQQCGYSDMIFHSYNQYVGSEFRQRVSLLEPNVSQKNCSLIINDLRESDSGSYQLRVVGWLNGRQTGYTFYQKATVSVKDLTQKPSVMIPSLTEGQQTTLTCTAPGLCAGSQPKISWMWREAGGKESDINGNFIASKTESVTAVMKRHSSTLTITPTAELHGTKITCKVDFEEGKTTKKISTLKVKYVKKVQITGDTSVKEGETLNLTCSVESFPPSVIMWTKAAEEMQNGTDTILQNSNLTDLQNNTEDYLQEKSGVSSFIISNVTVEDSGQYICTAKHLKNALNEKVNVTVIYIRQPWITGDTTVKKGDVLNLTCSVESFPPSLITWRKLPTQNNTTSDTQLYNGVDADLHIDTGSATLIIPNVTEGDSGQYECTAEHLDTTVTVHTDLTVAYIRQPWITGETTLKKGDVLNLTCSVESFPPSLITWRKLPTPHSTSSDTQLHNGADADLHNDTGSATLIIPNVTAEDSGQYECTAKHLDTTVTVHADVTVAWVSMILNGSGCVAYSEVLTCMCKSEGFPLPTIQWPQLKKHTDYSVITTVSNHTVSSTLTVKNLSNTAVECVSSNDKVQATENLSIQRKSSEPDDQSTELLKTVIRLEIIIAFLSGVLLSGIICCLGQKCYRKKQKGSGNLDETLEMVTSQDDPLINDRPSVQDDHNHTQEGAENGAVAADKAAPEHNSGPKDVEYASINFSLLRRKAAGGAAKKQESTETEYAEIKKEVKEEQEDDDGEEGEMLEAKEEEEVVMEEDEETKPCVVEEEKEEEEAVYSTVKDIMDDI